MRIILEKLGFGKKVKRLSPQEKQRIAFEQRARNQFLRLKEKGLSISVMSL
ncbi:hypothetical protein HY468_02775 [Candidatus Roizmanbacteria bacterium]|nr:hypothetical protein [Candidatus Roizmanbacteria bacterium]